MEIDWNLVIAVLTLIATALIGYFAYNVTKVYSKKSDEHNQDVLFHQLFRDFNARYSDVNFSLQDLLENYSISKIQSLIAEAFGDKNFV